MWAKALLQNLISDIGMKSSRDDLDGIDLSSWSTLVSITVNSDIDLPPHGWSDDSGSYCWPAKVAEMTLLMLRTLLTQIMASTEQNNESASLDAVAVSWWLVARRSLNADHTWRSEKKIQKNALRIYICMFWVKLYRKIQQCLIYLFLPSPFFCFCADSLNVALNSNLYNMTINCQQSCHHTVPVTTAVQNRLQSLHRCVPQKHRWAENSWFSYCCTRIMN